jgi:hypothetical protein
MHRWMFLLAVVALMSVAATKVADARSFQIDKSLAVQVCGSDMKSNAGHSGCTYCNKILCYDIDCTKASKSKCNVNTVGDWGPPVRGNKTLVPAGEAKAKE